MFPLSLPTKLLIALALMALSAFSGWKLCNDHRDAQALKQQRDDLALYRAGATRALAVNQQISLQLAQEQQGRAADRRNFQRSLNDAKRQPGSLVVPLATGAACDTAADVRLSADFGRLWNQSLAIGLPAGLRAGGDTGPDPWADPTASVTPEAALQNLADNAEQNNELRARLRVCQSWARMIGAAH